MEIWVDASAFHCTNFAEPKVEGIVCPDARQRKVKDMASWKPTQAARPRVETPV